jgi:hypothetical protein
MYSLNWINAIAQFFPQHSDVSRHHTTTTVRVQLSYYIAGKSQVIYKNLVSFNPCFIFQTFTDHSALKTGNRTRKVLPLLS